MKNYSNSKEIENIKNKISEAFKGLHLDEETHTYTLNGSQLISTTTYLKRFSDSFNSFHASEAKGKKMARINANDRRTGQYYRARWKYVREEASNAGNRVHMYAECFPDFDLPCDWKEQAILDFYEWLPENYEVLFLELRVYDEDTMHAGTVDGLLYNKDTGNLVIYDWKTNSRNINELYKNKNLKGKFKKLKSTSLNKYSIQLSDYANMIETHTDFKVEERWIVWLRQKPLNKKDQDRSSDYTIRKVKCDVNKPNFKLYKVADLTKIIDSSYKDDKENLKKLSKPAKVSKGLFTKKTKAYDKNKKGMFTKK